VVVARPAQSAQANFTFNGRIAITHREQKQSAGLRWMHSVQKDELSLLAPLGQIVARIERDAAGATLQQQGKRYEAADVESLMLQVLGWHLPLEGLHRWVLGLPSDSVVDWSERDAQGRLLLLRQDGWEIRYLRYTDDSAGSLPAKLELRREDLNVILLVDEWEAVS
jgi:outer membrane lipoprotein LolB